MAVTKPGTIRKLLLVLLLGKGICMSYVEEGMDKKDQKIERKLKVGEDIENFNLEGIEKEGMKKKNCIFEGNRKEEMLKWQKKLEDKNIIKDTGKEGIDKKDSAVEGNRKEDIEKKDQKLEGNKREKVDKWHQGIEDKENEGMEKMDHKTEDNGKEKIDKKACKLGNIEEEVEKCQHLYNSGLRNAKELE